MTSKTRLCATIIGLTLPAASHAQNARSVQPVLGVRSAPVIVKNRLRFKDLNRNGVVDSYELAQYYAQKRGVPAGNMVGITVTGQYAALYYYYTNDEYAKFITEFVTPIKTKLAALGPTNIDVILLAGAMPGALFNAAGEAYSIDNWLMGINYWSSTTNNVGEQDNPYYAPKPSFQTDYPHFDHNLL